MKVLLSIQMILMTTFITAQTKIIAHRGASYLAPENTLAAAKLAWKLGADAVEVDIHLSSDNQIMVIHNKTTKNTCLGKNLTVKSASSDLLRGLDAGSFKGEEFRGEKIPFLSEIIEAIPDNKILVVEIKCGSEVIIRLKNAIEKSGKSEQIVFICFNWQTILDIKKAFPKNKCYWLSYNQCIFSSGYIILQ